MPNLKGTKTEANLLTAFAGESQARNKYTYYASKAKKDGFEQIAAIFMETAENEKEHAKIWFKLLHDGIPSTTENLLDAAAGENYEWTEMYAQFAKEAKEEGFDRIAYLFEAVGNMRNVIANFLQMLKMGWYSPKRATLFGNAGTAAISILENRRRKNALSATIHSLTSA